MTDENQESPQCPGGALVITGTEGETVLLKALNCLQGERYIDIAGARLSDPQGCRPRQES